MIYRMKPNLVLGMGGYVTGPGGIAAVGLRCPLIIHEQNAYAGFTNRCLRPFATHALQAFPGVLARAETVGNPVRSEIMALPSPELRYAARDRQAALRILVLGGSRGALAINTLLPKTLALLPEPLRPEIWHQTGADHEIVTQAAYQTVGVSAKIQPFIQDMAEAYAWADLVIARAGALTIFELAAVGMGSILIPYPFAVDDHQSHNAQYLVKRGAAYLLPQAESTPERLMAVLMPLIHDRTQTYQMAACAREAATPEALAILVEHCKNTLP
jgi:UDP-N-acetylglucosamine--N-acetylmuramyl-(pentapeptide) pyrophosphoryl-undecaprenol N-acetylglucosamine transferase